MPSLDHNDRRRLPPWLAAVRRLLARFMGHACAPGPRPEPPRFSDRYQSGIFLIESSRAANAIAQQAAASGLTVVRLNGKGVASKAAFLVAAARDLRFPDYFGHNWDAFADCLGDFAAAPAPGMVLIVDHYDDFARAAPHDWRVALTILKRAAIEREQTTAPLYVFLHGPDAAPDIPAINAPHR